MLVTVVAEGEDSWDTSSMVAFIFTFTLARDYYLQSFFILFAGIILFYSSHPIPWLQSLSFRVISGRPAAIVGDAIPPYVVQ